MQDVLEGEFEDLETGIDMNDYDAMKLEYERVKAQLALKEGAQFVFVPLRCQRVNFFRRIA